MRKIVFIWHLLCASNSSKYCVFIFFISVWVDFLVYFNRQGKGGLEKFSAEQTYGDLAIKWGAKIQNQVTNIYCI